MTAVDGNPDNSPKMTNGQPKRRRISFCFAVAVVGVLCLYVLLLLVTRAPRLSHISHADFPPPVEGAFEFNQITFETADGIPLIALVFRHQREDGLLDRMDLKLVTSEVPHAAYVNGKRLRPEKGALILLVNAPDGSLQRIPISPTQAAGYFMVGTEPSRGGVAGFWEQHVASHLDASRPIPSPPQ